MLNIANIQSLSLNTWNLNKYLFFTLPVFFFIASAVAQAGHSNETTMDLSLSPASITQSDTSHSETISIEKLLQGFVNNGSRQLFDGIFVYLFEDTIQTFKVVRNINENGEVIEEFIPLDSHQKKSQRLLVNQYCSLNNGWQFQFKSVSSSFPFRINNLYSVLQENYDFSVANVETVAGISALGLNIKAKDPYRYGYQLWFEPQTSILLKYKLVDQKNKIIEQYVFTDISFKNNVNSPIVNSLSSKSKPCQEQFSGIAEQYKKYFYHEKIPKGYEPISFRKGVINNSKHIAYQFQFSDGIAIVSVFIEELEQQRKVNGVVKFGPVNVSGKTVDKHQITVLGAVPIASTLRFLKAIKEPLND